MTRPIDQTANAFISLAGFIRTNEHQRIARAIYEVLASGRQATVDEISVLSGVHRDQLDTVLDSWPATFRDDGGTVTGFFGLSADEHNHRFEADGYATAWTWCTYDSLFITRVLGVTASVTSVCPVTGAVIELTVGPDGVATVTPSNAVMSMLSPDPTTIENIITNLCQYIRLFASPAAATEWVVGHEGTYVTSIDDAFEIGRRMVDTLFAADASPTSEELRGSEYNLVGADIS